MASTCNVLRKKTNKTLPLRSAARAMVLTTLALVLGARLAAFPSALARGDRRWSLGKHETKPRFSHLPWASTSAPVTADSCDCREPPFLQQELFPHQQHREQQALLSRASSALGSGLARPPLPPRDRGSLGRPLLLLRCAKRSEALTADK